MATRDNKKMRGLLDFPKDGGAIPRGPMGPSRLELSKPVIAAIEGPAVAGGMELALWADCRVMGEGAYMGVYCRRWGVPLVDGGTVRLPRIVGQGRALEIIITGRKVEAEECLRIGLCEKVVPRGEARKAAEEMAQEITRFPQGCVRADRRSVYLQQGLSVRNALEREWGNSIGVVELGRGLGRGTFCQGRRAARRLWKHLSAGRARWLTKARIRCGMLIGGSCVRVWRNHTKTSWISQFRSICWQRGVVHKAAAR